MTQRLATATVAGLRRSLYPLLALPVGIACLALIVVGRHGTAASLQRRLVRRLLSRPVAESSTGRVTAHALLSLPINAAAFVLAGYLWLLIPVLIFLLVGVPIMNGVAWLQGRLAEGMPGSTP